MVRLISFCAAILLTGCVQTNAVMVDQRTAIISTKVQKTGTPWDALAPGDNASVLKTTLKEAAALTRKNGFRHFELLNARDQTRLATYTRSGGVDCVGPSTFLCSTTGPTATTVIEPAIDIMVRMYAEGEIDPRKPGVFDADWVAAQE